MIKGFGEENRRGFAFSQGPRNACIRFNRWKMVFSYTVNDEGEIGFDFVRFLDLSMDCGENENVKDKYPELVKVMEYYDVIQKFKEIRSLREDKG